MAAMMRKVLLRSDANVTPPGFAIWTSSGITNWNRTSFDRRLSNGRFHWARRNSVTRSQNS